MGQFVKKRRHDSGERLPLAMLIPRLVFVHWMGVEFTCPGATEKGPRISRMIVDNPTPHRVDRPLIEFGAGRFEEVYLRRQTVPVVTTNSEDEIALDSAAEKRDTCRGLLKASALRKDYALADHLGSVCASTEANLDLGRAWSRHLPDAQLATVGQLAFQLADLLVDKVDDVQGMHVG